MVEGVLSTLWERRPFKHDLEVMMFSDATEEDVANNRGGPLWEDMMRTMEDAAIEQAQGWA
jgi:hypothetical protein